MPSQPITARPGRPALDPGPFEGVPPHLVQPLTNWLRERMTHRSWSWDPEAMHILLAAARIATPGGMSTTEMWEWIVTDAVYDRGDAVLDLIHVALQRRSSGFDLGAMMNYLNTGGSVWRATPRGLERRTDPVVQQAYESASKPKDIASSELVEAWSNAYGRGPNASDAWDHAIKAVEAVLIPIVVPAQAGAHLGHVLGELDHRGDRFELVLTAKQGITPVETVVGMLRLIYPNPDRHVGPDRREATLAEAQAVVHLAVTLVQWGRDKVLRRK